MASLVSRLCGAGVSLSPLRQAGREVALTWDTALTGPILGDELLVAIPDMHLSDAGSGDVFRGLGGTGPARLERLLRAVLAVRAATPALRVVQLGDLYDVWRAYPEYRLQLPPAARYDRIEDAYGPLLGLLVEQARARVCIGNHDAILGLFPPAWARGADNRPTGQLAYGHSFGGGRVLAFHGHQDRRVGQVMAAPGGFDVVKLMTLAARLAPKVSQTLQDKFDLATEFFADPDVALLEGHWPFVDAPPDAGGWSSGAWCARNGRDRLGMLVSALRGAPDVRVLLVGHSHCPGVSMTHLRGRMVPVVDVGSWVHDRSQIAVAEEGRLGIYTVE